MNNPELIPVIVGVGEYIDRPTDTADALEPTALMAEALKNADCDATGKTDVLLHQLDSIELIGLVSWRYQNPVASLCKLLDINPAAQVNASMGGETPIRLIHDAAVKISQGKIKTAAIVGGEAMNAVNRARKQKLALHWTPLANHKDTVRFANDKIDVSKLSKNLGVRSPTQMYPLYEMAAQASWQQSPDQGHAESAKLWEQYAATAAENPYAWLRHAPDASTIGEVTADNRYISWPYPKFMVANPSVNQAAAVIVTSLANARAAGVAENKIIYIWGGAAAAEPDDFIQRDRYDRSTAQTETLLKAVDIAGGDARKFGKLELYSCFPVVPKMALRELKLSSTTHSPTVAGGLSFFGGPLNNYMSHAACAMVRALRASPGELGLLYGQGGFVSKHHTLVVSTTPPIAALNPDYSVQAKAEATRDPVPVFDEYYSGPATIETYTIQYGRNGTINQGIVILRGSEGQRTMARVTADDAQSIAVLLDGSRSAVGAQGHVKIDNFGKPTWQAGPLRARSPSDFEFAKVERDGHLTVVTINCPATMNALTPQANDELAEIFNDFAKDPEQWVAILTGAGEKAFSAGNDLKHTAEVMAQGEVPEVPSSGFAGLTARFDLDKPIIAAVNGVAMGGGFEIALACDLIIAAEHASFALPEPKVGLAAVAGGLLRLPRQIGQKQAMSMILTGRKVSATEAKAMGFVHDVVSSDELMATAKKLAADIIACSPMSIQASKQIVRKGLEEESLETAYQQQNYYPATRALYKSADFREGPSAFAQKRPPVWKGR